MGEYFIAATVRGPFNPISVERLEIATKFVVDVMGPNHFGSLVENFSFGEDLLLEVSNNYPRDTVDYTTAEGWIEGVRNAIYEKLLQSAIEIYLKDRDDTTWVEIGGDRWTITGGMVSWDGEEPTLAYKHVKFIAWSGLDTALFDGIGI
jgi:hypothetical protein